MSWLRNVLKLRKKSVENPVYRNVGYWNGICPSCGAHVGVYVLENVLTKTRHKFCANCTRDIEGVN